MKKISQKIKNMEQGLASHRLIYARQIIDEFVVAMDAIKIHPSFSDVVDKILNCKGKIICSGIGKAGLAIKKFSSLLCSFGFSSCFLHPTEAQHGDLGVIQNKDILFICSVSGKTREVYELIALARKINVGCIIGLTSHPDSPIRNKVDIVVDMGLIQEAGHLRMAPTTSILTILAITDALALVAANEKGLTKEQYSRFHHSGYLGKKARGEVK